MQQNHCKNFHSLAPHVHISQDYAWELKERKHYCPFLMHTCKILARKKSYFFSGSLQICCLYDNLGKDFSLPFQFFDHVRQHKFITDFKTEYGFHQLPLLQLTIFELKFTTEMKSNKPTNRKLKHIFEMLVLLLEHPSRCVCPYGLRQSNSKLRCGVSTAVNTTSGYIEELTLVEKFLQDFCPPVFIYYFSPQVLNRYLFKSKPLQK